MRFSNVVTYLGCICKKPGCNDLKRTKFLLQHPETFCNYLWSLPTQSERHLKSSTNSFWCHHVDQEAITLHLKSAKLISSCAICLCIVFFGLFVPPSPLCLQQVRSSACAAKRGKDAKSKLRRPTVNTSASPCRRSTRWNERASRGMETDARESHTPYGGRLMSHAAGVREGGRKKENEKVRLLPSLSGY